MSTKKKQPSEKKQPINTPNAKARTRARGKTPPVGTKSAREALEDILGKLAGIKVRVVSSADSLTSMAVPGPQSGTPCCGACGDSHEAGLKNFISSMREPAFGREGIPAGANAGTQDSRDTGIKPSGPQQESLVGALNILENGITELELAYGSLRDKLKPVINGSSLEEVVSCAPRLAGEKESSLVTFTVLSLHDRLANLRLRIDSLKHEIVL